ncbi:conserved hypothetical protein [Candidatus Nitrosotenuis uzonensis]|uniref:Uncharacterized protein n=1 Tax=Candidatus Nitrosotenuis uzonensis TaxID=1407055 RepID=V6AU05_9ARCH|nr:conserved hypothetical protein [Candidatus Nitrosotenuis uzonensis]
MVIIWIGIGIGILLAAILIKKIITTSPRTPLKFGMRCNKCGYKTNGLKCPRCENAPDHQRWK